MSSKSFAEIRAEMDRAQAEAEATRAHAAGDLRCKAHGCPNAGSSAGHLCFEHQREPDPTKWQALTTKIRAYHALRAEREARAQAIQAAAIRAYPDKSQWAERLRYRHEHGDHLTLAQREAYAARLGRVDRRPEDDDGQPTV